MASLGVRRPQKDFGSGMVEAVLSPKDVSAFGARGTATGGFRRAPLIAALSYIGVTFLLFLLWPINWPIYGTGRWVSLIAYVLLCLGIITLGYMLGSRPGNTQVTPFRSVNAVIVLGAFASIALLAPLSQTYTGRWPWEVFTALDDQGEAYRQLQAQLDATTGQRGPVALVRALLAPMTFAVIPLGILHWATLSFAKRGLVLATVLCAVIFSILRGTDREFADLFIVGGSALLISAGRYLNLRKQLGALIKRFWKPALLAVVFLAAASSLFTERKSARLGGYEDRLAVCANNSRICADVDAPGIAWLPLSQRFGLSFFILSSASGFYGLQIAMEKEFEPTYGIGHSPATLALYEMITADQTVRMRTFNYRNGNEGWVEENYWSTLITWIANDVGFPGAVLVLGLIAFLWGRSWRDAVDGRNDAAAIIFCQMMTLMIYLPANNQVFGIYDGYTVFLSWLAVWLLNRPV
jgi:hypothetical protein